MTGTSHIRPALDLDQARKKIRLDWPGAAVHSRDSLSGKLIWVPFDPVSRRNLASKLAPNLDPDWPADLTAAGSGPPPGITSSEPDCLYRPFWIFEEPGSTGWVAVDAALGTVLQGDLSASPATARMRLWTLLLLSTVACFVSTALYFPVINDLVGTRCWRRGQMFPGWKSWGNLSLPDHVVLVCGLTMLLLLWWYYRRIRQSLVEPIHRLRSGRIVLPLNRNWRGIFPGLVMAFLLVATTCIIALQNPSWRRPAASQQGYQVIMALAAIILAIISLGLSVGFRRAQFSVPSSARCAQFAVPSSARCARSSLPDPDPAPAGWLLGRLTHTGVLALVWIPALFVFLWQGWKVAFHYASENCLPPAGELQSILLQVGLTILALIVFHWLINRRRRRREERKTEPVETMVPDLYQVVAMCLRIMALALAGKLIGDILSGLKVHRAVSFIAPYIGPFACLHLFPLPAFTRGPLAIGIMVEGLTSMFLGPLFSLGSVFIFVAISAIPYARRQPGKKGWLWPALRLSWSFCLGGLLGRLAGRTFAFALLPLLGLEGIHVAQVMGFIMGAALGIRAMGNPAFLRLRSQPTPAEG